MTDGLDDVAFLARSPNRLRILEALPEPRDATELQRRLDIPRTTLRRNLTELSDRGWIDHAMPERTYRLSTPGRTVLGGFRRLLADVQTADRLARFLDHLPASPPLERGAGDYRVTLPTAENPHRPIERLGELLRDAEAVRVLAPIVGPLHLETVARHADAIPSGTVVLGRESWHSLAGRFPERVGRFQAAEGVRLLAIDDPPAYGLGVLGDTVVLGSYTGDGTPHSILEASGDDDALREWTERTWRVQTSDATPVEVPA